MFWKQQREVQDPAFLSPTCRKEQKEPGANWTWRFTPPETNFTWEGTISKGKQSSNPHFLGERLVFGGGTIAFWGNCGDLRGKQANSFILDHRLLLKVMSRLVILICHRQPLRKCQREWSQRTLPGTLHPCNQLNLGTSSFIYESEQHIWISLYGTLWSMFETRNWHTTSPRLQVDASTASPVEEPKEMPNAARQQRKLYLSKNCLLPVETPLRLWFDCIAPLLKTPIRQAKYSPGMVVECVGQLLMRRLP